MGFDSISRSHVGHRRKLNEDAVLDSSECLIWAVADGMGGHQAGEVASTMVVEALARIPLADNFNNRVGKALGALEEVNQALIELSQSEYQDRTIGSTVVGLIFGADEYRCFWAGDSRAYLIRGEAIAQLSRDHSLVQDLVDAGMLEADEAENHPNANVVTRAVGASPKLAVDTVGGKPLATILRSTQHRGCVAACGLVAGVEIPTTVYPFILRGVMLVGIDSANFDGNPLAWGRVLDEIVFKLRTVENFCVLDRQQDIVLLNPCRLRRLRNIFDRHAQPGPILHRCHMNPEFGKRKWLS